MPRHESASDRMADLIEAAHARTERKFLRTYDYKVMAPLGPGPWDGEPDKVQWIDAATGFDCLAVRHISMGNWCGYVGVPRGHWAYLKDHDAPELADVYAHGGLTFADKCSDNPDELGVCHVESVGAARHVWWFGFDCAHINRDIAPLMELRMKDVPLPPMLGDMPQRHYWTLDEVCREVESLAKQLAT